MFGAPSFVIDGEIFWGQDRLDFVDRKLGDLISCRDRQRRQHGEAVVDDVRHQRRQQRIGAPPQPAEQQAERQHQDDVRRLEMGGGEGERAHDPAPTIAPQRPAIQP